MTLTVEALYEDGVLKLAQPLPLADKQRVQVTVQTSKPAPSESQASPSHVETSQTILNAEPPDEAIDPADYEMLSIVLKIPPSPTAITVVPRCAPIWPGPYQIDESDLTPE